jgi:hypothetical protein
MARASLRPAPVRAAPRGARRCTQASAARPSALAGRVSVEVERTVVRLAVGLLEHVDAVLGGERVRASE